MTSASVSLTRRSSEAVLVNRVVLLGTLLGDTMPDIELIMAYEEGNLDDDGVLALFSQLIKSGAAWKLQGSYGRAAATLIERGYLDREGNIL
jgi:hypothetical protein